MTAKPIEATMGDIGNLDRQIEILMDCKPLSETEVKQLCEKVAPFSIFSIYLQFEFHLLFSKNTND